MAFEFREDGQFLLREQTPLEQLIMKAVYSALEQGVLATEPASAEVDGKTVYLLAPGSVQPLVTAVSTAVLQKARETAQEDEKREQEAKKTEPKRGRYRTESRACVRCGQPTLVRIVREAVSCPFCAASSFFSREAGQRSAQLLCEQCGNVFTQAFDTSRDHRARYVSTVGRDLEERSRFLESKYEEEREKELAGEGKTWTFPPKMPPQDNGDWEK